MCPLCNRIGRASARWCGGSKRRCPRVPGGSGDEHAVETGMTRLRAALGRGKLVQTVVKRGYRLSLDPIAGPVPADQPRR